MDGAEGNGCIDYAVSCIYIITFIYIYVYIYIHKKCIYIYVYLYVDHIVYDRSYYI